MDEKRKMKVMGKNVTLYTRKGFNTIYMYFSHEDKKYKVSTGVQSFDDVKIEDLITMIVNIQQGRPVKKVVKQPYTLIKAFHDFVKYKEEMGTSERTIYDYNRKGKFILEKFGKMDVVSLGTTSNYEKYRNWKKNYYKNNPSKQTIKYIRNGKVIEGRTFTSNGKYAIDSEIKLLIMIMRWCQKLRKIPREVYIDEYEEFYGESNETLVLTKDDYVKITDYMKKDNPFYCNIVRFVNNTGIRYPSELNPLKWKHIDFKKHTISIEGRKRGRQKKSTRVDTLIPMTNRVANILMELKNRPDIPTGNEDYIFVNNEGERVMNIIKYWNKSLVHLGIDTSYTMYSLRHLFATRMIKRSDISLKMISEWMGHSTTQMLQRTYAKWIDIDSKVEVALKSEQTREDIIRESMLKRLNETNGNGGE